MITEIFFKNNTGAVSQNLQRLGLNDFSKQIKEIAETMARNYDGIRIAGVCPAYYAESVKDEPREGCVILADVTDCVSLAGFAKAMVGAADQGKIQVATTVTPLAAGFEPGRRLSIKIAEGDLLAQALILHRKQKEIFAAKREPENTAVVLYQSKDGVYLAACSLPDEDADEWQEKIRGLGAALRLPLPVLDAGVAIFKRVR